MPEPLFIIAPPRSYTSLIGGMIGQHPQIYGLPELNLAHTETLGGVMATLKGPIAPLIAGILRLLAELHEGEQTEDAVVRARSWMMKRAHWTVDRVFQHIQEQVGDRILLEKSPMTVMNVEHMRRRHRIFPRASYLHLTRHPVTTGTSLMSLRETMFAGGAVGGGEAAPGRPARDPENQWRACHENIEAFTAELEPGQCLRVKAELLLSDPEGYLAQICDWLGIDSSPEAIEAMMHPETSPFACLGPPSAKFGNDPNYLKNPALDRERIKKVKAPPLDTPITWRSDGSHIAPETMKLARQFGYG
ncbi:sulfotransferase [Roseivivax sp. THAF30]|uniref:sulfotransferase family protein n=1 Tax=Roseivivax sp. THAF30 TaxID=2587852 RepID=UPI0012A9406F|nr:sulfotransferase [Roseivivax sp. THAF30]QFT64326.1 hypothetical protein FIU91_15415 [Roseivivax sp. THAF30]